MASGRKRTRKLPKVKEAAATTVRRMNVIPESRITEFSRNHSTAESALKRWLEVTKKACWKCFQDVRKTFGSADYVLVNEQQVVVFNIGGNNYRLIAGIEFEMCIVVPRMFMTHAEYTKGTWKDRL